MKVAFISPYELGGLSRYNIGLAYVMSSVAQKHEVTLLGLTFRPKDYLRFIQKEMEESKPDVIAFSVTTYTFQKGLEIAGLIRRVYPDIPFIFGGVHPTLLPEETIEQPLVDAICIGEGEKSFLEYLDKLEKGQEPEVDGIWYKDSKGSIHKNPLRPFEEDIDSLTFPNWDYWGIKRYLETNLYYLPGSMSILSSRGCPYNCSFCSNKAIREAVPGRYYRVRSPENVIAEIKMNLEKYQHKGLKSIFFGDEIFGVDYRWLEAFCELYIKEGLSKRLPWYCETRADIITKQWARTAARANCKLVLLGIESGDDYIRRQVYKKDISQEAIMEAVPNLKDNGIAFMFSMILGCPQDTKKTIRAGIKLVKQLNPIVSYWNFYQPLPKTELASKIVWQRDKELKEFWQIPRIRTLSLNTKDLNRLMLDIRIMQVCQFLRWGIKLKKGGFILDIIKYIFSIGNCRKIPLRNFYIRYDIEQKTIFKYILSDKENNSARENHINMKNSNQG